MRILDQQIVQPIDHALQTNANDIAGGRDSLVRVALGIHHSILTALELVYVQFRRCWTPLVLPRPFCKLAESIQGNRNFAFTPVQVRPPPKHDSPNEGRWYRCPECEGVVKAFWPEGKGYDMAATFAGHLVAKMPGEEVPLACMNCQKEFENAQRLGSHVFQAEWEGRQCWAPPPEKLKPPINYSSLSDYA
jgi:DNA-directed RNA polymerase subunit RPC12/RpoP